MKPAIAPLNRILRDVFRVEPLEARVLLSADPVLGAAQIVLRPPEQDAAALVAQAYTAPADAGAATLTAAPTPVAPSEWLAMDTGQLSDGNGEVVVGGALRMSSLSVQTLAAVPTESDPDDLVLGDVIVDVFRSIEAGTDGSGSLQLGTSALHSVNGNGDTTDDYLELKAANDVRITGRVGNNDPLEGLTVTGVNVDFGSTVIVNGNLVINATGIVTFASKVTLTGGGNLEIVGAGKVVFANGLELIGTGTNGTGVAGNILITANEIDFTGGGSDAIKGQGLLQLRPADETYGIDIGSLPASAAQPTGSTLNLDTSELKLLADGFSSIVIGVADGAHAKPGAGAVRIGAVDSLTSPTFRDSLEVYGGSISVEDLDNLDYTLKVVGTLKLDAVGDISISNRVEALDPVAGNANIDLYSDAGRIQQLDAVTDLRSAEPLKAAALSLHAATGISLPYTEVLSVSAVNTASGDLTITETALGGDVAITLLSQQAISGGINLRTTAGSISVGGTGIANLGSGATELQAAGTLRTITVNQAISSGSGLVRLTATGAIALVDDAVNDGSIATGGVAAIELLSTAAAITQGGNITSGGGAVSLDAFTFLAMVDGVHAASVNGSGGSVALRARGGDVTVSVVEAGSAMAITASGAIIDGLTGSNPNLDGETAAVLLAAARGIGASASPLQTQVGTLAATNTASGGVFVREATTLRLAGGTAGFAIDSRGTSGNVAIVTVNGALTVGQALSNTGSMGHMLLQSGETAEAMAAGLLVRADISSVNGSLSLLSADGIVVDDLGAGAPMISVAAPTQTIDVEAADGIAMEALASFSTAGGSARLHANGGDISLGVVSSGAGSASLSASGSIVDAQSDDGAPAANVIARSARLQAGAALGAGAALVETQVVTLAASAGGALFLADTSDVTVGSVAAVSVNRIDEQGTIASNPADTGALAGLTSGGALVLRTDGHLVVDQAISGAGNLLVASTGTLGITTTVGTTGGNVSVLAGGSLTMSAAGVISSTIGSIDLESTSGAITMADGAVARTNAATIRAQAATTITVGLLDARSAAARAGGGMGDALTWGTVSVVAGSAIADNAGETATDIYGQAVRLQASSGIAAATEKLETEAGQLSATAGTGDLFLVDATGLVLSRLAPVNVQRVAVDGTSAPGPTDAPQAGLASGGALVVQSQFGSIVSTLDGTVSAAGNLLLEAHGGGSFLEFHATVSSSGGSISLVSQGDVILAADVSTAAAGKSIDVLAASDLTQRQGASLATNSGNIALEAAGGQVILESANAGTGGVWISGTNILDADAAGDTETDIVAASAQLLASGGIGAAGAALETQVATLTANAGTAVYLAETDGLAVDRLQLDVDRIAADGSAATTAHAAQEDLSASTIVLASTAGDLTFNAGTAGTYAVIGGLGNVLLQAVGGSIDAAATIDAFGGNATLVSGGTMTFRAGASVLTAGGTLDLESQGGSIAMADGALAQTAGGSIRLKAATDVVVGQLDAGAGSVSIVAGGAIADNAAETGIDIVAGALRLEAGSGVGTNTDALETEAAQLSAAAGTGDLFLAEATGVTVTQLAAISVNRVASDGTTLTAQTDAAQAGLTSGGALVLQAAAGTLTTTAQGAVAAGGNVLLQAGGAASDLELSAMVTSSGGFMSLAAGRDVLLGANVSITAAGKTLDVLAGGAITQAQGSSASTVNADVAWSAGGTVTLEALSAGSGVVSLAGTAIVDGDAAGDAEVDVLAGSLQANASAGGIGASGNALETTIAGLVAHASGDVFVTESDALGLSGAVAQVERVAADGTSANLSLLGQLGVAGANVVLRTLDGALTTFLIGGNVSASGNLLLEAGGATGDISLAGATTSAGAASVLAGHDMTLSGSLAATAAGSSIDVAAQGRILAQQGSTITANNANVQLVATGGSVTLESVNAGTGTVRISGTSISDGDAGVDAEVDIVGDGLMLTSTGTAGTGANPLETSVNTLTVSATGIVGIVDSTGLLLGSVTAGVNRVGSDGATSATAPVTQSGVTGSTITLRTLDGALTASATGTVTATGNVLLKAAGAAGDVTLSAAVSSSTGNISVDAARHLTQGANISTVPGAATTVDLLAGGNLEQLQGAAVNTGGGDVSLAAGGTLTIETVSAGTGRVRLGGTSVVDGDIAGDTEVDVLAAGLRVTATAGAIGSAANGLETSIATLSAVATGDVFIVETDALELATVAASVNRVATNGAAAALAIAGQNNVSGAIVVVRTLAGSLSSQISGAILASGNVLLQAGGASSNLTVAGTITSSGGHVSLAAGQDMTLGASVTAAGSGKSLDFVAGRNFVQSQGTLATSADGNIGLQAGGSATIESLDAGAGQLRIAAASVTDGDTASNETQVDLVGSSLQIATTGAVGGPGNALETSVQALAAATGDLYLTETDALTIAALGVDTQRVGFDGVASTTANATTSGVSAGTTVIQAKAGTLDSLAAVAINASGNLLLKATGAASDLVLRGAVTGGGFATFDAGRDLTTQGAVTLATANRSLVLLAGRDFLQAEGASASTNNGAIALTATGNAQVDTLAAGTGAVRIAAVNVVDVDADGDAEADVLAGGLQLVASGAIGTAANALETGASTLSLQASGAAFVTESDALQLGSVSVATQRVGTDGTAQSVTTSTQTNVASGAALVLRTLAGTLTSTAQGAVRAAGNLLLAAGGATSDLGLGAAVSSSDGSVSLAAGQDLVLGANVATAAAGATIDLLAGRNAIQAQGMSATTNNGNIALEATGNATLETLAAGTEGIWVSANAILDGDAAGDGEVDLTAASAQLRATGAIGAAGSALETSVDRLAAQAGGNLFVTENSDLAVGSLAIDVVRVGVDGGGAATAHAALAGLAGATTVLRTVDGSLSLQEAVNATGNLLLQAGGASGDLVILAGTAAAGALSLDAGRDLGISATVSTTTAGATIDLLAQRALTALQGSLVMAADANVLVAAGGDVTLESVLAGAGSVRVTGANLFDGDAAGDTEVDIAAAQLQVVVTGAVGSTANAFETTVATLSISAGGAIVVDESDALVIGPTSFSGVARVGVAGTTANTGTVAQSDLRSTGGGIALGVAGDLAVAAQSTVSSSGGAVVLSAQGSVALADQAEVRTTGAATIDVTAATGTVLMDPDTSLLQTGSGDIHVTAEGDIRPGALVTTGKAFLDARNGRILIAGDLQRNGEDVDLFGDDLVITVPVSSPGGTLRIGPLDPGTTILIGDAVPGGPALQVDTGELALLQDGFAQIVIGSSLANTTLTLDGVTAPLVFNDPLLLTATGAGGTVAVNGSLTGDSLTIADAGAGSTLRSATIRMQGSVLVQDQLVVDGPTTMAAGIGGSGNLQFTQAVTGQGGAADTLALSARGGNVQFDQAVSGLDGLTVSGAADVRFGAGLSLDGDLVIDASGTVTFGGPVTLHNGARLIIRGTANVVFASTADFGSGGITLQTAGIASTGGAGSLRGTGLFAVQGTTAATPVFVGSGAPAGSLQVGDDVLRAIGAGFDALRIGSGASAVIIADSDFSLTGAPVRVEGSSIAIATTGAGMRYATEVDLHATGAITTSGQVVATTAAALNLRSDTAGITMAAGSLLRSLGGDVVLDAATGLAVAGIDARSGGGGGGLVTLRAANGLVVDANADAGVDVYARGVTLTGLGPELGGGDVLEVAAALVRVDSPVGVVMRETGTDGRTYFNVLDGAELRQALVAVGGASRVTSDLDTFISSGAQQSLAAVAPPSSALQSLLSSSVPALAAPNGSVQLYLASSAMPATDPGLTLAERLQAQSELSFASGQSVGSDTGVDYWSESVGL